MAEELVAVSTIAPAPAEQSDYDSICAALMQTERGRWFLEEYAKRNRSADTRVLLAAIQRIETVVCADRSERDKQAQQGFRTDLLEMAKAITRTRAEVAEIPCDSGLPPEAAWPDGEAEPPPRSRDVFSAAERIRDVTWAMRGHGFDPATCDQLEELAASILSASALRDPTDRRASKLSDVLQYLEHRIETLLVASHDGEAAEAPPEPHSNVALSAPAAAAEPELAVAELAADNAPPDFHRARSAAHDDLEGDTEASPGPAIAPPEPSPPAPELQADEDADAMAMLAGETPAAEALECQAEDWISAQIQEVEAQTAGLTSASDPDAAAGTEPQSLSAEQAPADALLADAEHAPAPESDPLATDAEPAPVTQARIAEPAPLSLQSAADEVEPTSAFADEVATEALAADGEPAVVSSPMPGTVAALPGACGLQPAAALRAVDAFLPEMHMRAVMPATATAPAGGVLQATAVWPEIAAATAPARLTIVIDLDEASWSALGPPEPDRPSPSPVAPQPEATEDTRFWQIQMPRAEQLTELTGAPPAPGASALAAAAPMPPAGDPLAALEVMSANELIALFS